MPTATMTSAPKKKRDFFNGSQGLNLRDFRSPEPQEMEEETVIPEGAYVANGRRPSAPCPPTGFPSSLDAGGHSLADYSFPDSFPNRQSPPGYYNRETQDSSPPIAPGYDPQSRGLEYEDSAPLIEAPVPYPSGPTPERPSWTGPQVSPTGDHSMSEDGRKKGQKRKQRCRMCANHGIYVEIKGHKWYCPYKNPQHSCPKCEITRKRQYFMAEQQKLTREQQQQQHLHLQRTSQGEVGVTCVEALTPSQISRPSDFPRMRELLEETSHILDENLFRQLDEHVRPRVIHH